MPATDFLSTVGIAVFLAVGLAFAARRAIHYVNIGRFGAAFAAILALFVVAGVIAYLVSLKVDELKALLTA